MVCSCYTSAYCTIVLPVIYLYCFSHTKDDELSSLMDEICDIPDPIVSCLYSSFNSLLTLFVSGSNTLSYCTATYSGDDYLFGVILGL